jgi:hypothetical protein
MSDQELRESPQPEPISASERNELSAWATKHGMAIRNATDEQLVLPVWRKTQLENTSLQTERKARRAAS